MENYYVSVAVFNCNAGPPAKFALALGPFATHQEALDKVADVKAYVSPSDSFCEYSYGTCKSETAKPGKLNAELGYTTVIESDTPEEAVGAVFAAIDEKRW